MKIISGGQIGVDQIALELAQQYGLPTGGTMAKGWETRHGPMPHIGEQFGLEECVDRGFPNRIRKNVIDADCTLLFLQQDSRGCRLTRSILKMYQDKDSIVVDWPKPPDLPAEMIADYIFHQLGQMDPPIGVLNIAGPSSPQQLASIVAVISGVLRRISDATLHQSEMSNQLAS